MYIGPPALLSPPPPPPRPRGAAGCTQQSTLGQAPCQAPLRTCPQSSAPVLWSVPQNGHRARADLTAGRPYAIPRPQVALLSANPDLCALTDAPQFFEWSCDFLDDCEAIYEEQSPRALKKRPHAHGAGVPSPPERAATVLLADDRELSVPLLWEVCRRWCEGCQ